ncbi:uroporphyrinogen-III synthase [Nitrogeniibacter mangrovi]|uniref:Uroporphyrinogen-III synthase n=1 Tax=Nitrogeniibacter mangrovi TaxID=2016596 RepID=A0A6C1B4E5_9RHOO|nr:uroporphyrinogen-III synthase [Nitrogeniibacter mangrovi]QID17140.1 uroporphyrinogen-III synthase [Nitrogeniibacter mangrovi]
MSGASPLAGRRIVVTRPPSQADGLRRAIEARGGSAECIPVMLIEAMPASAERDALIDRLDTFSLAFFVSANAVRFGLEAVHARRQWPATLAVATVGPGSERALLDAGFDRVIAPHAGFDSEAVLALPEFAAAAVRGKGVVIFRGNGGRDLLGDTLTERGATVAYAACYRRVVPVQGGARLVGLAESIDAIVLTSSEGVDNLVHMVGDRLERLRAIPVICAHPRIAARASAAGFAQVVQTAPGDAGLIEGMEHYFQG